MKRTRQIAACLAIGLAACTLGAPLHGMPAAAATVKCATHAARIVNHPPTTLSATMNPTETEIGVEFDVGSDGRVRGVHLIHGSGDAALDAALKTSFQSWTFTPATSGCVAFSTVYTTVIPLRDDVPVHPIGPPISRDGGCVPFVGLFITPVPHDPAKHGTAVVNVPLDAAGALAGMPTIATSSGSATLDTEALRLARTAQYGFNTASNCTPAALTYSLELTFL
jgi:TonB family protein